MFKLENGICWNNFHDSKGLLQVNVGCLEKSYSGTGIFTFLQLPVSSLDQSGIAQLHPSLLLFPCIIYRLYFLRQFELPFLIKHAEIYAYTQFVHAVVLNSTPFFFTRVGIFLCTTHASYSAAHLINLCLLSSLDKE